MFNIFMFRYSPGEFQWQPSESPENSGNLGPQESTETSLTPETTETNSVVIETSDPPKMGDSSQSPEPVVIVESADTGEALAQPDR